MPQPNQDLVIFCGVTDTDARNHFERIEADTDARGVVALLLNPKMRWFQVWHQVGKHVQVAPVAKRHFIALGLNLFTRGLIERLL